MSTSNYLIGLDVGSTTVKAVAVDEASDQILWSDYQRHETKQPEKTLEFLKRMEADLSLHHDNCRVFITGSGGGALAPQVGGKFVQEVTAVSLAVEKLHPEVNSVVELGGQEDHSVDGPPLEQFQVVSQQLRRGAPVAGDEVVVVVFQQV